MYRICGYNLSKMNIYIPDEKEKAFRKLIIDVYGFEKGSINDAVSEAIDLFIVKHTTAPTPKVNKVFTSEPKRKIPEIRPANEVVVQPEPVDDKQYF